jgi:hypothetical protein
MGRERIRNLRIALTVDGLTENRHLGIAAVDDIGHTLSVGPGVDHSIIVLSYPCACTVVIMLRAVREIGRSERD